MEQSEKKSQTHFYNLLGTFYVFNNLFTATSKFKNNIVYCMPYNKYMSLTGCREQFLSTLDRYETDILLRLTFMRKQVGTVEIVNSFAFLTDFHLFGCEFVPRVLLLFHICQECSPDESK